MSTRVYGFPAGKHRRTGVRAHSQTGGPTRQPTKIFPEKGNRRRTKRADALFTCLFSPQRKGKTPTRGEINFSNSAVWHEESKKNKSELGTRRGNGDRNSGIFPPKEEINSSFPMRFSDVAAPVGCTLAKC